MYAHSTISNENIHRDIFRITVSAGIHRPGYNQQPRININTWAVALSMGFEDLFLKSLYNQLINR